MGSGTAEQFIMYSVVHISTLLLIAMLVFTLYWQRKRLQKNVARLKTPERFFALSLLVMDIGYHIWLVTADRWRLDDALPLELCSISLFVSIVLLWTGNRYLIDFVIFDRWRSSSVGNTCSRYGFPSFPLFPFLLYACRNHFDGTLFCMGERL